MKDDKKIPAPEDAVLELDPNSELPPDADIEERFNEFWKKNGPGLFGGFAVIALIFVGFEVNSYLGDQKAAALSAEYATLESPTAKLAFAQDNSGRKLGGVAFLEVADSDYAEGLYDTAAQHYAAAEKGLAETPLIGRARLGAAVAKLRAGEASAHRDLEMLARDPSILPPYRGEAAYLLAVAQWEVGDLAQVRRALDLLGTIGGADAWQAMGLDLEAVIPGLRSADLAAAETGG